MEEQTRRQVQGAVELLRDATQATAAAIGSVHQEMAETPYRVLRRIPVVSRPAGVVECMQRDITRLAYASVGPIAGAAATVAKRLLQAYEGERREHEAPQVSR